MIMNLFCRILIIFVTVCSATLAGVPVISDFSVIGSQRGIAFTIGADAGFEAKCSKVNSSTVKILIGDAVYGLNSLSFDDFSSPSPIRKISVRQLKGSSLEITLKLNSEIESGILSKQKDSRYLFLLSNKPVSDFNWTSSSEEKTATVPQVQKLQSTQSVQVSEQCQLSNIQLLQRENISELLFTFDKEVTGDIRRSNDSILIVFPSAKSALQNNSLSVPSSSIYKTIRVRQISMPGKSALAAVIVLNSKSRVNTFAFTKGNVLSIYVIHNDDSRVAMWTSDKGQLWDHVLIKVPEYKVDLKSMSERARHDVDEQVAENSLFKVTENSPVKPPEPIVEPAVAPVQQTASKSEAKKNPEPVKNIPKEEIVQIPEKKESPKLQEKVIQKALPVPKVVAPKPVEQVAPQIPVAEIEADTSAGDDSLTVQTELEKHIVRYHSSGRDPFRPLFHDSLGSYGKPDVASLKLVGILYDNSDRMALFEDVRNQNKPYIIRENDGVENGKLLKIYKNKVVFLIDEYGISHSFTLQLKNSSEQEVRIR